jgi:hypothetical protein
MVLRRDRGIRVKRLLARLDSPGFLTWMVLTAVLALLPTHAGVSYEERPR